MTGLTTQLFYMQLCEDCGQVPRFIQIRPETKYLDEDGVWVIDQGYIGICACDPRYEEAGWRPRPVVDSETP